MTDRPAPPRYSPRRSPTRRRGFTLIELMVVILIIGILGSMVMSALYMARESSKKHQTRATIQKLHSVLMESYESYQTRRLPLSMSPAERATANGRAQFASLRMRVLWDTMRTELPDSYRDIEVPGGWPNYGGSQRDAYAAWAVRNSAVRQLYQHVIANSAQPGYRDMYASAECLYMIVNYGTGANNYAPFLETEIGDLDEDGMPEFIDGWARPIHFIRWPAGFIPQMDVTTDLQTAAPNPASSASHYVPLRPDAFDKLGVARPGGLLAPPLTMQAGGLDIYGFNLVPLIYSSGPDGVEGLRLPADTVSEAALSNPWTAFDGGGRYFKGTPYHRAHLPGNEEGGGYLDNIHNHALGGR